MKRGTHQDGLTMIGWFAVIILVAFFSYLGMKIVSPYMHNLTVVGILKNVVKEIPIEGYPTSKMLNTAIKNKFSKHLNINSIYDLSSKNLSFGRDSSGLYVQLIYDKKVYLTNNMKLVIHFDDRVNINRNW